MSGKPAARVGDMIACPVPQATPAALPHAPPPGLPIIPAGAVTVLVGGRPAARLGDASLCVAPVPTPNPIATGAFPVPIEKKPAARLGDPGTHPGSTITPPCCPTVLIGLSGTAGNAYAGNKMCQAAKQGRNGGSDGQNYNNCGVESSRQIINKTKNVNISEDDLLTQAINNGNAGGVPGTSLAIQYGGTNYATRQNILADNGVPSSIVSNTANPTAMPIALGNGQGVIASVDAAVLWPVTSPLTPPPLPGSLHAILVTGMEYDDDGKLVNYVINDTGTGQCSVRVPASTMQAAMAAHPNKAQSLNITELPIF